MPNRDWHAQNIKMVAALTEKGYDVNFTWGIGTHSNKQGGAILPEMLRWLWRDYPRPDDARDMSNRTLLVPCAESPSRTPPAGPIDRGWVRLADAVALRRVRHEPAKDCRFRRKPAQRVTE